MDHDNTSYAKIGITTQKKPDFDGSFCDKSNGFSFYTYGKLRNAGVGSDYGIKVKNDVIIGVCLNMINGTLWFSVNSQRYGIAQESHHLKYPPIWPSVALSALDGCSIKCSNIYIIT